MLGHLGGQRIEPMLLHIHERSQWRMFRHQPRHAQLQGDGRAGQNMLKRLWLLADWPFQWFKAGLLSDNKIKKEIFSIDVWEMICKKLYNIYDPNWEKNIIVKFPAFFYCFFSVLLKGQTTRIKTIQKCKLINKSTLRLNNIKMSISLFNLKKCHLHLVFCYLLNLSCII